MRLGVFTMPMHDPARGYGRAMEEDHEMAILADRLGYDELWVGEHFTTTAETVTSPLIFMASLIPETRRIVFGTGVLNAPLFHPAILAGHVSMFDHLSKGRLIVGIGAGGLLSDLEMFKHVPMADRPAMVQEAVRSMIRLWTEDPPYDIPGKYWPMTLKERVWERLGIGTVPKPFQKPHPPVALSIVTPNSSTAKACGRLGFLPVSANFIQSRFVASHWAMYREGCAEAGRKADPGDWRVARSVLVTESDAEAEDYLDDPASGLSFYYDYFVTTYGAAGKLAVLKPADGAPDAQVTVREVARSMTSFGSPKRTLDRLVAFMEETGPFGTLLAVGHDWDRPEMWKRSMRLLAEEVMPKLGQHAAARARAAE
jgi:alkanesulfonate monooxygenase SsuD/methylene tetrahydromethanopterin reductase-like flavin-dependent oxidoreductase (luciferase family)